MPEQFTNDATTTLASNLLATDLVMHTTGPISGSPAFPSSGTFRVRIVSTGELCAVTAVSGNDFTITRQDGGSALSGTVLAGATIEQVLTKEALAAAFARIDQANAGTLQAQGLQASGVGQFTTPGRFLGVLSVQGPPTSGTYQVGDWGYDSKLAQWVCSVAGTPGTWLYAGGGPYHAEVYLSANQNIATGTLTIIAYDTLDTSGDPNSNVTLGASFHYTCPVPGVYRVTEQSLLSSFPADQGWFVQVNKNGSLARYLWSGSIGAAGNAGAAKSAKIRCAAADTLDVRIEHVTGSTQVLLGAITSTFAHFELVSS